MSTASIRIKASVLCALVTAIFTPAAWSTEKEQAREILDATGVTGGLIVHVGSGDGRLTAALGPNETAIVHGLDADAENVAQARSHVRSLGLYGRVSVEQWAGSRLPYADNLVNLLVSADLGAIPREEVMRVLAPQGVAYLKSGDTWTNSVKPRPDDIDEWTHYLHDASNNAVAHDDVVGPPGRLQWNAEPRHTRSHEHIPGIYALVSTGGRIFYIADEGPIASIRGPARWHLVARDAFNGVLLWKKPVASWFPHIVNWGQTPRQLQRKLVAVGDRVYVTLGLHAPLSAVDAASGETLKVYEETEGAEEVVWHEGTLLVAVRSVTEARTAELAKWAELLERKGSPLYQRESAEPLVKRLRATESKAGIAILALDADTGRVEWKKTGADAAGLRTYSLCAEGNRVFYQKGQEIVCLDIESGQRLWSAASAPLRLVSEESVFSAGGKTVTALSAETGQTQWTQDCSVTDVRDVFLAGGSLWIGGFKPFPKKRGPAWGPYFATERDPATGEMLRHVEPENPGHHHRCYDNKATDRYILGGRRGTEFIDLATGEVFWHSWARGVCRYGVMPANGLLYAPPHACGCYVTAKLTGFNALAARRDESRESRVESPRIERGPAYDRSSIHPSSF
ncbi:MAG: PQQ-binding-like beta-propeller repeat protein, partial [Planctomycetota bacterium]